MSEDPDLEKLTDAFAALKRSRQRMDAIAEQTVDNAIATDGTQSISQLLLALERGEPLTEDERRAIMDYLNGLALGAQGSSKHEPLGERAEE